MPDGPSQVRISIGSRFENIDLVDLVAEASLRHMGLDDDTVERASLAVREAVANGVLHGNRLQPDKRVDIDLDLRASEVVIEVCDQGEGFDLASVPDPLAPENLLKPNGRGIFLMRKLMDEVGFRFDAGCGTVVTLRKTIACLPGTAVSEEEGS